MHRWFFVYVPFVLTILEEQFLHAFQKEKQTRKFEILIIFTCSVSYISIYMRVCAFCACIGSSWRNDLLFSKTIHYFLSLYIHIFLLSPRLFNDVLYEMEKKYRRRQHRLECMVVWLSIVQVVVLIACRLETCKKGKTWSNLIKVFFYCKNGTISSFDHDFVLNFSLYDFMIRYYQF